MGKTLFINLVIRVGYRLARGKVKSTPVMSQLEDSGVLLAKRAD